MASSGDYDSKRDGSRILGIPLDHDKPQGSLEVTSDTTAWDVYNHYAGREEREIIKDWNNTLNILLVFAGLYSAVLTAFITESMKLLQEDSSDATRDILLHISRQLAVTSTAAFIPPSGPFIPPEWALRVNYCFFFSLSCALITALAAVLALQWVGSYDRGLNPSSVESRALQRQFRMEGAKRWKLEHIIAFLPTIIFISLLLFFVGLAEWLWNIHHNVAIIIMVGASVGALFYITTTLASMLSIVAPFRTPASRYLPLWFGLLLKSISRLFKRTQPQSTTVNTVIASIGTMMTSLHPDTRAHVPKPKDVVSESADVVPESTDVVPEPTDVVQRIHRTPRWRLFFRKLLKPIAPLYSIESFETREQRAVAENKDIKLSSLFWVARSISIEPCHRQTLMLIMEAILKQPKGELQHDRTNGNLWGLIFAELYIPYKGKKRWVDYSSEDLRNASLFVRGVSSIGQSLFDDIEFRDLVLSFYGNYTGYLVMYQTMKQWKQLDLESERRASILKDTEAGKRESRDIQDNSDPNQHHRDEVLGRLPHRAIEFLPGENTSVGARPLDEHDRLRRQVVLTNLDVALSFRDYFPLEFIVATLQRVKRDPSQLALITIEEMFGLINKHLHIEHVAIDSAHPLPFPVLDLVQETITTRLSKMVVPSLDPVVYSDAVTKYLKDNEKIAVSRQSAISAHEAIMEQAISNLIQINALKVPNSPRVQEILVKLDQLAQFNFGQGKHTVILALSSMLNTEIEIWSQNNRIHTAKLMLSLLKVEHSNFNGENWTVWWTEILPAFGEFIDKEEATDSIVIKHGQRALLAHLPDHDQFSDDQINKLTAISHPGVRLFATAVTQSTALAKSVLQKSKGIWTPSIAWMEFIDLCFGQLNPHASENENFLRAFVVGGSSDLYDEIYEKGISRHVQSPSDLFKYLQYPILSVVLRHAERQPSTNLWLLDTITRSEAFSTEFSKSQGFTWMPAFVHKHPAFFGGVLSITHKAIIKCNSYSLAFSWIKATLECQVAVASTIGNNPIMAQRCWKAISKNANQLIEHIKSRRETGVIPPVGPSAPNDMQEGLSEANPVGEVVGIAKNSGLTAIEDDAKSRLHTTVPQEWSISDKKKWETLVDTVIIGFEYLRTIGEPTSYKEVTILQYDIALLRRLTLTGPYNSYKYIYPILGKIIASSTMSLEYFHTPVLNRIMQMDFDCFSEVMETLRGIYKYTWLPGEFIKAGGLELLPLRQHTLGLYDTIKLVTEALPLATTYKDTLIWLRLTSSCLNSVGSKVKGSGYDIVAWIQLSRWYLHQPPITLEKMKHKWHNDRGYQPIDEVLGEGDTNEGVVTSNARLWSPGEWDEVQEILDALLAGLKRGYIMPAPSAAHHRFIRDPDGLCSYF